MGKKFFYIILPIIIVFVVYLYLLIFSTWKVKYDLSDCVRYFDEEGRYRLMQIGDIYFFVDAEKEYGQKPYILQYYYDGEMFYSIYFSELDDKRAYFLFNVKTGEKKETLDIDTLSKNEINILNSSSMIKLDPPNDFQRHFRKFIPLMFRKK